jgi:hypothetical protein
VNFYSYSPELIPYRSTNYNIIPEIIPEIFRSLMFHSVTLSASLSLMENTKVTAKRNRKPIVPTTLAVPNADDIAYGDALAVEYRENGICSNRQDWNRLAVILACYACVVRTGLAVRLPDIDGASPTYNRAWRAVGSALSPEQNADIKVCAVRPDGMFSTTTVTGNAYMVPKGTPTKGQAPSGW